MQVPTRAIHCEGGFEIAQCLTLIQQRRLLRPVVMRQGIRVWPAFGKWTPNWLREQHGHIDVSVLTHEQLTGEAGEPVRTRHVRMNFGDYLSRMGTTSCPGYLAQYPLFRQVPELANDLSFPNFTGGVFSWSNIWIGPINTRSHFHFDADENMIGQIYGRKRLLIVAPEWSKRCYPINATWSDVYSPVDPLAPDVKRYPRFAGVPVIDVTLEAGDLLYVPRGWWHDVRALETSISVNRWWWPPRLALRNLVLRGIAKAHDVAFGTRRAGFGNGYPFDIGGL